MPHGRYSLHDPHDGTPLGEERFHCAAGPSGWRYTAEISAPDSHPLGTIDLTTDQRGRALRLTLSHGAWQVRGTTLDGVTWVRADPTGDRAQEGNADAVAFTGASPAFLVATARLLRPEPGAPAVRVRLLALTGAALAPRTLQQSWALSQTTEHPTDSGPLVVEHYQVSEVGSGEVWQVHLAGDVVLSAPGVELEDLDSPPSGYA